MVAQPEILESDLEVKAQGFKVTSVSFPYTILAKAVLRGSVKHIQLCPRTLVIEDPDTRQRATRRLKRSMEALKWAVERPKRYVLWCDMAEIDADWMSEHMITLARSKNLLWKAWEASK